MEPMKTEIADARPFRPATDKQKSYIVALLKKHTGYREEFALRVSAAIVADTLPIGKASDIIEYLKAKPLATPTEIATTTVEALKVVPDGHYAVASTRVGQDLDFFRVDNPDKGPYAGKTFVKHVIGGRPETRIPFKLQGDVLKRIVDAGINEAAVLYGKEIGRCYVCNRELTDELSRSLGIGPHCRAGK